MRRSHPHQPSYLSDRNAELTYQLRAWSRQNKQGKSFDSSTGFKLPNGTERSPDPSWVKTLSGEDVLPGFVLDLAQIW